MSKASHRRACGLQDLDKIDNFALDRIFSTLFALASATPVERDATEVRRQEGHDAVPGPVNSEGAVHEEKRRTAAGAFEGEPRAIRGSEELHVACFAQG